MPASTCWARLCSTKSSVGWSPFWLRFKDSEKEAGFLKAQKPLLLRRVQAVTGVGLAIDAFAVLLGVIRNRPWEHGSYPSELEREAVLAAYLMGVVIMPFLSAFLAFVCCHRLTDKVGSAVVEIAAIFVLVVVMVANVLGSPVNVARLRGYQASEVFPCHSDSRILLVIDGIITAAHVGLPIRWFIMLPLQVTSILLYAAVIFIGGSERDPLLNVAFLSGLVAVSSIGKRYAEIGDRQAFLKLIREKQLRCEAEFQLSQVESEAHSEAVVLARGHAANQAEIESAPTSKSGTAFSPHDENLSVAAKLARIAGIGRAEHWLIGGKSIKLFPGQVLGRGGNGTVIKATMNGTFVAVKLPKEQFEDASIAKFTDICNEMRVLRHLKHPNIVSFNGAIVDPLGRRLAVVLEYVKGVILDHFVRKGQRGEEETPAPASTIERFQILLGTCSALVHMHAIKPCIVHSDLKATNIMVEMMGSEVRPKLLDFGFARVAARGAKPRGGTLSWIAPEALTVRGPAKPSLDVYSFGHLINFVSTGARPKRLTLQMLNAGGLPPSRQHGFCLEPVCGPLADECLQLDQTVRPSMSEVHHRLVSLPQHVQLPNASPSFLEGLRILAAPELQLQSEHSSSKLNQGEVLGEELQGEGSRGDASAAALGMRLPAVPSGALPEETAVAAPDERPRQATAWKPCPWLPATQDNAMLITLVTLATRWNPEQRKPACCELHASVKVIQRLCSELKDMECKSGALPRPPGHCPECGLLAVEPGLCEYCGVQLQPSKGFFPQAEEDTAVGREWMAL